MKKISAEEEQKNSEEYLTSREMMGMDKMCEAVQTFV